MNGSTWRVRSHIYVSSTFRGKIQEKYRDKLRQHDKWREDTEREIRLPQVVEFNIGSKRLQCTMVNAGMLFLKPALDLIVTLAGGQCQ